MSRQQQLESRKRELERKRRIFEARMSVLKSEFEVEEAVLQRGISESKLIDNEFVLDRGQMVQSRAADASAYKKGPSEPTARARANGHG